MIRKKGDLSLSVNAIVVFVLAFAMLGVGLFFSGAIRDKLGGAIGTIEVDSLQTKPTPENPLTVPNEVEIKKGKTTTLTIGYYNNDNIASENAKLGISNCIPPEGETMVAGDSNIPTVTSTTQTVDTSKSAGFKIIIKTTQSIDTGIYVCTMVVYNGEETGGSSAIEQGYIYDSKEFFLNVGS